MKFTPGQFLKPESEEEIREAVRQALSEGRNVHVVGAAHSSTDLVVTNDTLISLDHWKGFEDRTSRPAKPPCWLE